MDLVSILDGDIIDEYFCDALTTADGLLANDLRGFVNDDAPLRGFAESIGLKNFATWRKGASMLEPGPSLHLLGRLDPAYMRDAIIMMLNRGLVGDYALFKRFKDNVYDYRRDATKIDLAGWLDALDLARAALAEIETEPSSPSPCATCARLFRGRDPRDSPAPPHRWFQRLTNLADRAREEFDLRPGERDEDRMIDLALLEEDDDDDGFEEDEAVADTPAAEDPCDETSGYRYSPRPLLKIQTEEELRPALEAAADAALSGIGDDPTSYNNAATWRRRLLVERRRLVLGSHIPCLIKFIPSVVKAYAELEKAREAAPVAERDTEVEAAESSAEAEDPVAKAAAAVEAAEEAAREAFRKHKEREETKRRPEETKRQREEAKRRREEEKADAKPRKKAKAAPSAAQIAVSEARATALAEARTRPAAVAAPRLPDCAALFAAADEDMARRTKAVERFGLSKKSSSFFFVALSDHPFVYVKDADDFVGKFRGDAAMQERFTGWLNPRNVIGQFLMGDRSVDGLEFRRWPEGLGAEALAAAFAHAGHPRYRGAA